MADEPQNPRDRDVLVPKHRTPAGGVPVGEFSDNPSTDVRPGESREMARRRKTPSERIERLEERADSADKNDAVILQRMDGQDEVLGIIKGSLERLENRDDIVFTSKVEVRKHEEIKRLDDDADAKKQKRERITQIIKGVLGGAGVLEIIHRLFL